MQSLVIIVHAISCQDQENVVEQAAKMYTYLLLNSDMEISFAAKAAIVKLLRPHPKRSKSKSTCSINAQPPGPPAPDAGGNDDSANQKQPFTSKMLQKVGSFAVYCYIPDFRDFFFFVVIALDERSSELGLFLLGRNFSPRYSSSKFNKMPSS